MPNDKAIVTAVIQEAVKMQGGNGLSSPPFQPPLNFMLIFAWINVENGVEALVSNGEVLTQTRLKSDFLRLMGKRVFFHRVLLKPAPISATATALSRDEMKVSINVSLKLEVLDPVYVASAQDPLGELTNLITGITAETIRFFESDELVSLDKEIKQMILAKLSESPVVSKHYSIIEILNVMPIVDETLIEIRRKIKAAESESGLIEVEGKNKVISANYEMLIEQDNVKLQEAVKDQDHARDMEKLKLESQTKVVEGLLNAFSEFGRSGISPGSSMKDLIGIFVQHQADDSNYLLGGQQETKKLGSESNIPASVMNQKEKEIQALNSIKEKMGIVSFEVLGSEKVNGAVVQCKGFEVLFTCPQEYPDKQPTAVIRRADGSEAFPSDYWVEGVNNLLAQAVVPIILQAE